jgi:hypothetical protein
MATARYSLGSAKNGTQTAALGFGGFTTTQVASTEEWTGSNLATRTITTS